MKALVGAFNQEKALVGAFSVIVKTDCGTDGALHSTTTYIVQRRLAHHQAHGLAAVPHQLDHVVPRGSEQKIFRHNHRKYLGREKCCRQPALPGHVLAVDGENLVAGHELVHAGAAASHEPGTGTVFSSA